MKALLCREYGPPESLQLSEIEPPACGKRDVRVEVAAAGVNFPDLLIIEGKYQFQPRLPFAPGGEVAGTVVEIGEEVTTLAVGDRVMGLTGFGGFAEQAVLPQERWIRVPDAMDFETAACFSMTYGTVIHALVQRGSLAEGEWLLVHGATGGVGTAAIEIGRCLGARVIATGGDADKLDRLARLYGLEHTVHLGQSTPWKKTVKSLTGGGADVIFDPVGGEVFEESLRCVAWKGRVLVVGFASGTIPSARANLLLLKGAAAIGVFWGAFVSREPQQNQANFQRLFEWFAAGRLRVHISHRYALADGAQALRALASREVIGKAVINMAAT